MGLQSYEATPGVKVEERLCHSGAGTKSGEGDDETPLISFGGWWLVTGDYFDLTMHR